MGIYVYAIGRAIGEALPPLEGLLGQPVYRLASGTLAAIVSNCPLETVRAERRHLAASQRVLSGLGQSFDLLPMAFGTLVQSTDALIQFLDAFGEILTAQLHHVAGRVEMGVRLVLEVPDAIGYLVQRTPELKTARDRMFGRSKPPSHDDRIRLGQLCEAALRRYRGAQLSQALTQLQPYCTEIRTLPVNLETEIANLAILVPRDGIEKFEGAVNDLAAQLPDELAFNINGPWLPHNFVQLDL